MVTDADYQRLRDRDYQLRAQVDFLYQHLGLTFVPAEPGPEDPRLVEALKKGNMLLAMKVYRELHDCDAQTAQEAVLNIKGRLGI
jgi:hypothetical protein